MIENQANIQKTASGKFTVKLLNGDASMKELLETARFEVENFAISNEFDAFEDCWIDENNNLVAQINEEDILLANILRAFAIGTAR